MVFCRNIQRYWILRRLCRSLSGPCAPLTWTFSGFILVLHGLVASSRWPSAGGREVNECTVFCRNIRRNIQRYWILRRICRSIRCPASSEKECADPLGPRSMRAFDMDIVLLHTGAPWPLCVLWMAISRLLCGAQVHSILSQYQAEYPAILDIATSVSLNTLLD